MTWRRFRWPPSWPVRRLGPRGRATAIAAILATVLVTLGLRSRLLAPETMYLVRDRHDRFIGEVAPSPSGEFGYWPVEPLPDRVIAATLAVEDRRFWNHPGVDPIALGRAVTQNVRSRRRISGASTIAMQVARMQYPGRRTYFRKAAEAMTALLITARHGRTPVLRQYLRLVSYGNRIHGIGYAARRYFDKPVEDLSWAETAFLAAIPQAPARMNPFTPNGRARAVKRGGEILDLLHERGLLGGAEHELAQVQIRSLLIPPPSERPRNAMHAVLRYENELRAARPEATLVRTTLDLALQEDVEWIAYKAVQAWEPQGARNAAVIVVDRATNEVRASVGSTGYFDAAHAGAIDYTTVRRSPGSALKPFLYALALERGVITPATILDDLDRGAGGIGNADDLFLGPMLPRVALASSRNVPAADILDAVGLGEGYAFLRDLGLHEGREPARRYGLGLAIGGLPVTLEHLVRAYGVLAADGVWRDLRWYQDEPVRPGRRLLSDDTTRQITLFLSDPMARMPSFARMGATEYPFPVAVKTGTSSRFRDAWTVAYSTRYVVGAWVGDPDFQPMNRLGGYRSAAELVHRILDHLHHDQGDGLQDLSFPPPRGFDAVRLCALTGRRATAACDRVTHEWFRRGTEPADFCRAHVRVAFDRGTGRLATHQTPHPRVELRTLVDLPPRYAAWAAGTGLPRLQTAIGARSESGRASPAVLRATDIRISVTSPESGLRVLRDPETPPEQATLALRAVVDPPVPQIVWYVDGRAHEVVDHPYTARWTLVPGEHVIEARLPDRDARSGRVRIHVE
jgi:penicillin-binding protein 1C